MNRPRENRTFIWGLILIAISIFATYLLFNLPYLKGVPIYNWPLIKILDLVVLIILMINGLVKINKTTD